MKMSKAKRKAYNQGKRDGFDIGYTKGLYDGNPFNTIIAGLTSIVESLNESIKDNPELVAEFIEAQKDE